MNRTQHPSQRQAARGVALIEVLVAMLIFAFGVLGLVGLQGSMTRAQTGGKLRAEATNLASEFVALMWTDVQHVASYNQTNCAGYAACKQWQDRVAATLPGGTTVTTVSASNQVDITVTWTVPGSADTQNFHTITTVTP